ncbi:ABC transporter permease [Guptibacillus hwajinpoensis]|uniref:Spermidine/putrescine transport system permease protein n=1 Tax=Guptibacillus hwajinpoensis TaxID=208199 RepID=A0ABU0JXS7_9BACL|nr:ABC transporter permease subunit [Alkalihalobacillus hemicentroti]MDQ0481874.1 putative spermidine/putrescine transport system permease protein [Alkalihalobacillus hemicentroti]
MNGQIGLLKNKWKAGLYLLPAVMVIFLLVGYGMWSAVAQSFQTIDGSWTTNSYLTLFRNQLFLDSIILTIRVTTIATILALAIGLVMTRLLYQFFKDSSSKLLVWIPILIPHFVAGYLVFLFLSQSGLLSSFLSHLGVIENRADFPVLVQDQFGLGIILTYVWKEVPFVILMLLPVYYEIDHRYSEVVRTLGGSRWDSFKTVEWPWLLPVLVETGVILFAFIASAFEVPYLLGVTRPEMLPVRAYEWFFSGDWSKRPLAFSAMIVPGVVALLLSVSLIGAIQKHRLRMVKGRVR